MNLVDEEHLVLREVRQNAGQIARFLEHRSGRGPDRHPQLVADDVGEGRLAEPRRAVQQDVIEGLAALPGRGDGDFEVLAQPFLADVRIEAARAQAGLELIVVAQPGRADHARRRIVPGHRAISFRARLSTCSNESSPTPRAASTARSAGGRP